MTAIRSMVGKAVLPLAVVSVFQAAACGGSSNDDLISRVVGAGDAAVDARAEASRGEVVEAGADATLPPSNPGVDAAAEASPQDSADGASPEAALADGGVDAAPDSGVDAPDDAAYDASIDSGLDGALDAATDATSDAGAADSGPDAAPASTLDLLFALHGVECRDCAVTSTCLDFGQNCESLAGQVAAGGSPAAGAGRFELCDELLSCALTQGCVAGSNSGLKCYCGTADSDACNAPGAANGRCKTQEERALETVAPTALRAGFDDSAATGGAWPTPSFDACSSVAAVPATDRPVTRRTPIASRRRSSCAPRGAASGAR